MSSTEPLSLIQRARGRDLGSLTQQVIGGWIFAIGTSGILGIRTVFEFLIFPLEKGIEVGDAVMDAVFIEPLAIAITGSQASAESVAQMELFGLPLGTGVLLLSFAMVAMYLRWEFTGNFVPGLPDFPLGREEEDEE